MVSPARILVVGMGSIGLRHARLYATLPDTVVEVCESRPDGLEEARRQSPGVECWTDYAAALASAPDYVVVATPHQAHAAMAIASLEKRIPVLCEKPMSDALAEAEAMQAASRQYATPLAVGYTIRFHPGVRRLRQLLAGGDIGQLMHARYCVDSLVALQNTRSRYQAHLPGALFMDYSHGLDLLFFLTRKIPATLATQGIAGSIGELSADPFLFSGLLGYDKAFQAEIHLSYLLKPEIHTLQLVGSRLGVLIELNGGRMEIRHVEKSELEIVDLPYERDPLFLEQWQAFRDFCAGKPTDICTGDEALETNRLIDRLLSNWEKS
jgi:predicted dehydrogenase